MAFGVVSRPDLLLHNFLSGLQPRTWGLGGKASYYRLSRAANPRIRERRKASGALEGGHRWPRTPLPCTALAFRLGFPQAMKQGTQPGGVGGLHPLPTLGRASGSGLVLQPCHPAPCARAPALAASSRP